MGHAVAQLVEALRYKLEVSRVRFPMGVIGIFYWINPSSRHTDLGLTHPLTKISTMDIFWGVQATGAEGWQPYQIHVPTV